MSVTALVLATLLLVSAIPFQDAFASNGEGPKQKHIDKHEEKHGDKHKDKHEDKHKEKHEDKHKDKHEDKHKEKHDSKKKEKLVKKIKEKIIPLIKEKLEKHKGKIIQKIKDKIAEYKDKKSKKTTKDDNSHDDSHDYSHDEVNTHDASNNDDEEITTEETNNEDDVEQVSEQVEETKPKMNKFKGSGNDYAPTLGTDRYGNNYVDNGFTFNDFVTEVENYKTHMPLQTLQVGELNTAVLKIYDNRGAGKIEHVELAFGLNYDEFASESKNRIIWKQDFKGDQSIIEKDSDNLLMDVNAVGKADGKIMELTFNFAFREPMDKSKIGLVVWDQDKHSRTVYFNEGIEVVGESLNPPEIVTILDEKGYPVKITMNGKNEGIDEFGNIWTHNSPWTKQSMSIENLPADENPELVGGHGFDRNHNMFDSYKNTQSQKAQEKLIEIYGGKNIYNFND